MKKWICVYTDRSGEHWKAFDTMEDGFTFIGKLDKRIEKGTCYGYMFSEGAEK